MLPWAMRRRSAYGVMSTELLLVRAPHDLVGDGLALQHAGDALHDVVQRLQVLDVDGGDDVDAGVQQLLHVLPALLVAGSRHVRVRQLIDQHHLGRAGKDGVHVHLLELRPAILHVPAGHGLQIAELLHGERAAVRLDEADDDVGAALAPAVALVQHGEGLAHAGGEPDVDAEPAAFHAPEASRSSARFSSRTFTRGSPRMPNVRPAVWSLMSCSTASTDNRWPWPRAAPGAERTPG